ncbi:Sterol 3-beta-glucosyltransferase [Psilocybe cubensis]|uniref:Sterol 3-beta-glucosyltransferase n=1 Tax=Psilocybe cubensis TaxID=181762 RepID=A0ACB8GY97_PSICU|nr:Sterol 3-beta-glucosyltransferase [Psilocybe cubensis]KAH9480450.1 Sterol 3-beta-glucosyltransferase [Psilocybe cubensis]
MAPNVSRIFSRRKPTKTASTDSGKGDADTTLSPKRSPSQSSSSSQSSTNSHLISSLYNEAGKFEKILLSSGCISPRDSPNGTSGFDDLVMRDLTKSERAYANHDARILAAGNSWVSLADLDESLFSDIDSNSAEIASVTTASTTQSSSDGSERPKPAIHRASTIDSQSLESMEPEDIVNILIDEFGVIAAPGEEEKLILETDGALLHDVAIVGVIHLTTHRLTFHASLQATRPDLSSLQEPIKAGPAIMHRKGWRTKRRVWVELTHDMLCAYSSSNEDEKARPLCSLLLSFVKDVVPYDKSAPRVIRFNLDQHVTSVNEYAEFDTEESAQEWRREIKGAIFSYRHLRRELFASPTPESSGVRFHCPLIQIDSLKWVHESIFASVVSMKVKLETSEFRFDNENLPQSQVFELGPCETIPAWQRLGDYVAEAKEAHRERDSYPPVVVDFGPYNFFETDYGPIKSPGKLSARGETAVRVALGFSPESTVWIVRARINRSISCTGYFALSDTHLGFWCKNITQADLRYRLPLSSVRSVKPFSMNWISVEGITITIEGKPDLNFTFKTALIRDQAIKNITSSMSSLQIGQLNLSSVPSSPTSTKSSFSFNSYTPPSSLSGKLDPVSFFAPLSRSLAAAAEAAAHSTLPRMDRLNQIPKVLNFPREVLITEKYLHFVCLTIGSRGDVQPYIALGVRLIKEGHTVTIVTHEEYRDWVVGFGIRHRTAGGDPGALMKLSVENKMFSPEFFKQSLMNFRPWLDQLLVDSWAACRDADVLLESPSAMAGVHIAEALNIPYFRTFTMPWTKTSEFPHAFLSPPVDSPTFNAASNVMWAATSGQINKWRRNTLGLASTDMGHLAQSKITFIYNFSRAVVPKPLDWPDTTIVSGYWFLDNPDIGWTPPQELLDWMQKARADGKPIVYIGFGSITVPRPNKVTATIFKAVLKSGVRAIVSKGWSARMSKGDDKDPVVPTPPECFLLDKVPHDWLFPRIDAAVHHGGAGTTGASLRAGIPTIIKPWFGDQFFWAARVQVLGAGLKVSSLHSNALAAAMVKATTDRAMKAKAASVGEAIRKEDGVHTAIYTIYTYLHRASLNRASLT